MKRHVFPFAVVSLLAAASTRTAAQTSQPALTVAAFAADRGLKLSPGEGEAIADELARQLVETGLFRVLQREWLPTPGDRNQPSMDDLRKAAASADVEYVLTGSLRQTRQSRPQGSRPAVLRQAPFGVRFPGPAARPMVGRGMPPPPRAIERTTVTLNIQVIDVASGDVIRRMAAGHWAAESAMGPAVVASGLLGGPAGALLATAAHHHSGGGAGLDTGVKQSIGDLVRMLCSSTVWPTRDER